MSALPIRVANADRMMTSAKPTQEGIEFIFADGCCGLVPFVDIPEIGELTDLEALDLPNPFEAVLRSSDGETVELPWDFVRHYCDPTYQSRIEDVAATGRVALGARIRRIRQSMGGTQEDVAKRARIGRVTLSRIENGEQSPRYETIIALARALDRPPSDLILPG